MSNKHICAKCRYVEPDPKASERNWTAYQCVNQGSDYYHALLNVTPNGEMQKTITWRGCDHFEPK